MKLSLDCWGLDLHLGRLSLYVNNADGDEPGSFSLHLPVPFAGVWVIGWEVSMGWDAYRISPAEESLLRWVTEKASDLSSIDGPTDAELADLQASMAIDEILGDD